MFYDESTAILISLVFLAVAIALLLALRRYAGGVDAGVYIALLVSPLLLYTILSGKVQEFSGPGGWGAKFREFVRAPIEKAAIEAEPLETFVKGDPFGVAGRISHLDKTKSHALLLVVGNEANSYSVDNIKGHLAALLAVDPEAGVVFLDDDSKFVASSSARQILAVVSDPDAANLFLDALRTNDVKQFKQAPFLTSEYLQPDDSNVTALSKFLDSRAPLLVVVADDGSLKGVLHQEHLLTQMVSKLANE